MRRRTGSAVPKRRSSNRVVSSRTKTRRSGVPASEVTMTSDTRARSRIAVASLSALSSRYVRTSLPAILSAESSFRAILAFSATITEASRSASIVRSVMSRRLPIGVEAKMSAMQGPWPPGEPLEDLRPLVECVMAEYGLSGTWSAVSNDWGTHPRYRLRTADSSYFVKGMPAYLDDLEHEEAVAFQADAGEAGAPTPRVLRTRAGRLRAQTAQGSVFVQRWIENSRPWPARRDAAKVGIALARFSEISRRIRDPSAGQQRLFEARALHFPDDEATFTAYFARHVPALARYGVSNGSIAAMLQATGAEVAQLSSAPVPVEWVVGDAHPANTLVTCGEVVLLDLDNARVAPRVWPLATYAAALGGVDYESAASGVFAIRARWDVAAMRSLVAGFQRIVLLDRFERRRLAPSIRLALAVLALASTNVDDDDAPTPKTLGSIIEAALQLIAVPLCDLGS